MLATSISVRTGPARPANRGLKGAILKRIALAPLCGLLLLGSEKLLAMDDPAVPSQANMTKYGERMHDIFLTAQARLKAQPDDPAAAWQFARACFDWADLAETKAQRVGIAEQGVAACRANLARESNSAPSRYYLGMNLGQIAQTKRLSALDLVAQMETEFLLVKSLDPKFDFAGADRNLGLLYLDAPGWPLSIGNKAKARQHLDQCVTLAPEYPENWLNRIAAELRWGEHSRARDDLKSLDAIWSQARQQFTGLEWQSSWADWNQRRAKLATQAAESTRPKSPSRRP